MRVDEPGALPDDVLRALKKCFTHTNPEFAKKRNMGLPTWNEPREIVTWRAEQGSITFPRGGAAKVFDVLTSAGLDVETVDARQYAVEYQAPAHGRVLYPYQQTVLDTMLEREQCIVRAPTGGGKTSILLAMASAVRVPTLVVVHSQGLLDQWKERAQSELGLRPAQIGIIQGKKLTLRPLTLTIQKSMLKAVEIPEVRDYFGCVLADEVQLFAAQTFYNCIDPMPARYRIGASADHRRKDRKEFMVHDLLGEVGVEIKRSQLIQSGHVLDVQVRVVPTDFLAPWYGMADAENPDVEIDFVRLCKEMAADPLRNQAALRVIRDEVLAGEQVLVMAHEREHCMHLVRELVGMGIRVGYLLGGPESAREFAESVAGLRAGTLQVGVGTYKAVGTGIDIPRIGVGVAVTPIAANEQFFGQVRGRMCRTAEGKRGARLYVLWDHEVHRSHLKNLLRWNDDVVVRDEVGDWEPARHYQERQ